MEDLDWDGVRVFLAVARAGSLSEAAKELDITQSTVARRLAALEDRLGAKLFVRTSRGHALSEVGEAVLREAEAMETRAQAFRRTADSFSESLAGPLVVSVPESFVGPWLLRHFDDFQRAHGSIALELVVSDKIVDLDARAADVVLRAVNQPAPGLVGRRIARLACAEYTAAGLAGEALPWVGWSDRRDEGEWIAGPYGGAPVQHRTNSAMLSLELVRAGWGIGRLLCFAADDDPTLVRLPPGQAQFERWLWVLTHADLKAVPKVRTLTSFLFERLSADRARLESDAQEWRVPPGDAET
ncbi:MAG: LysR family transcriptional regulator [Myxococcota bacterium]